MGWSAAFHAPEPFGREGGGPFHYLLRTGVGHAVLWVFYCSRSRNRLPEFSAMPLPVGRATSSKPRRVCPRCELGPYSTSQGIGTSVSLMECSSRPLDGLRNTQPK